MCSALTKCPAPVGASTRTLQCGLTAQTGRECHISENGDSHLGFSPRELFLLTPGTSDLRIPNVPWPKQDQHYRNTRIKCTSGTTWSHGTTASPGWCPSKAWWPQWRKLPSELDRSSRNPSSRSSSETTLWLQLLFLIKRNMLFPKTLQKSDAFCTKRNAFQRKC